MQALVVRPQWCLGRFADADAWSAANGRNAEPPLFAAADQRDPAAVIGQVTIPRADDGVRARDRVDEVRATRARSAALKPSGVG
jgi:hypothetical protein